VDDVGALLVTMAISFDFKEVARVISVQKAQRIALQLPDDYLPHASQLYDDLVKDLRAITLENVLVALLGDSTYSPCCVDEVTAQHMNADFIVHFGPACFSLTPSIPTYYALSSAIDGIDIQSIREELLNSEPIRSENPTILMWDFELSAIMLSIVDGLDKVKHKLIVPTFNQLVRPSDMDTVSESSFSFGGLVFPHQLNSSSDNVESILYIGSRHSRIRACYAQFANHPFFHIDPFTNSTLASSRSVSISSASLLKQRFKFVEEIKRASIIGLISTPHVGNQKTLRLLKALATKQEKHVYTFLVGKLTPSKLANFAEVDVFILVGCPESSLLDLNESSKFFKPIAIPFEAILALDEEYSWKGYIETSHVQLIERACKDESSCCKVVENSAETDLEPESSNEDRVETALVPTAADSEKQLSASVHSPAAEFFKRREWQGLAYEASSVSSTGDVSAPSTEIQAGLDGIARSYRKEHTT
jgi:diphthamide biosynthesis protein 2